MTTPPKAKMRAHSLQKNDTIIYSATPLYIYRHPVHKNGKVYLELEYLPTGKTSYAELEMNDTVELVLGRTK